MSERSGSTIRFLNPIVGKRTISGEPMQPLVDEVTYKDGKVERRRVVNPERSTQLPTYVFWDRSVVPEQQTIIRQSFSELFQAINLDSKQTHFYGNWHATDYKDAQGRLVPYKSIDWLIQSFFDPKRRQLEADIFSMMLPDPYQLSSPHWEIIFTNQDLHLPGTGFVIGSAYPDLGTIISLARLWKINDPKLRSECVKTEIFHELGHVLGLPSNRRGREKLEQSLGSHCQNTSCSMRQGLSVPTDWITYTQERLKAGGQPFCSDCLTDLRVKFKK